MTPAARVQAAIEILDLCVVSARDDGPPADVIVSQYFKTRRYAGSKDRRAVRDLVFRAIRRSGKRPESGRAAMVALADDETAAEARLLPAWIEKELSPLVTAAEWPALLERAPLDLRANVARTSREAMLEAFPGATVTPLSPWGLRLPADSRVEDSPAYLDGLVEVQDEGSQLIGLACAPQAGMRIIDLCAGAGGKALALAAAAPDAEIIACDTNRARLSKLSPRAARAQATIATRLIDGGREAQQLAEWDGQADCVLVDAPCSGSGTWRRSPEGRWRLTPDRLGRVAALQARLLDIAAPLVKPGGTLVYAVCSILQREGSAQAEAFLGRHSSWAAQDAFGSIGRQDGSGRLLTPHHDGTDGFFVARLQRSC